MVYDTYNYGEWMLMGFINQFKHNWGHHIVTYGIAS